MDFEARVKAVARLAESRSDAAERTIRREFDAAASILASGTDYEHLEQSLTMLEAIGFRFSALAVQVLGDFVVQIEQRVLTYSEQDRLFGGAFLQYRNSSTLIGHAIQALARIRYLETSGVLQVLLRLSVHGDERVRRKSTEALKTLSSYDINVFYGDGTRGGIGATPQQQILNELQNLSDADATKYFSAIVVLLEEMLSPTMESASWSYKALTLTHSATPAIPSVSEVRLQSIDQLIRIYGLAVTIADKLRVIAALTDATRTERRAPQRDETTAMFVRDAQRVLAFFCQVIGTDDLQVIQKIEHNTYWIFFHAISEAVKTSALEVRDRISQFAEYQVYRVLIGFEGIFGDWEQLRNVEQDWKGTDEFRRQKAREYAESIDEDNYAEWRSRILRYAQTKSDDLATFPVFYYFLEHFANTRPASAFRILSQDTDAIKSFLIPLLRGLWPGPYNKQVRRLIESWIVEGRYLYASTKQFLANATLDIGFVKRLLSRAADVGDLATIGEVVSVAVSNYDGGRPELIEQLMLPAVELLTERSDSSWLFDNWFRRELKDVLASLEPNAVDVVLQNLKHLRKLDYHAEEVLSIIAQRAPEKVLEYLCERLGTDDERRASGEFEAIPYELHKLNVPLSKVPQLAVRMLRERYNGDYSRLIYGGARLLSNIFPTFPEEFAVELSKLVEKGEDENLMFVLAVLRNYKGEPFIHGVFKEIVKAIPIDSRLRTEVAIALETTGVVSGEFGMAEAYERKRQEVLPWLDDADERVQAFAKWYIADLEHMRDAERKRAGEGIALRKFQYGED